MMKQQSVTNKTRHRMPRTTKSEVEILIQNVEAYEASVPRSQERTVILENVMKRLNWIQQDQVVSYELEFYYVSFLVHGMAAVVVCGPRLVAIRLYSGHPVF
jgi:hypothetical protein